MTTYLVDIIISESVWSNLSNWQLNDPSYIVDISEDAIYDDDLNLILELSDENNNIWEVYIPFSINLRMYL